MSLDFFYRLILTALDKPGTFSELATILDIPVFAIEHELKPLAERGFVKVDNGVASLTDKGKKCVAPEEFKLWNQLLKELTVEEKQLLKTFPKKSWLNRDNIDEFKQQFNTILKLKEQGLVEVCANRVVLSFMGESFAGALVSKEIVSKATPIREPRESMKVGWANLQFVEFNKEPDFERALSFLSEKKFERAYFGNRDLSKVNIEEINAGWRGLHAIIYDNLSKKARHLFEYEHCSTFYALHLAANVVITYFLPKRKIRSQLKEFIIQKIIRGGYFTSPVRRGKHAFGPSEELPAYYLALKWFYSEKTRHYYSEQLLKEMSEYEKGLALNPEWRKEIDYHLGLKY